MPHKGPSATPRRKKRGDPLTSSPTVADMFAASNTTQAAQDGRRTGTRDSPPTGTDRGQPGQTGDTTTQILQQLTEVKMFLEGEITRSTLNIKAEIQALGARTAELEQRMETLVQGHNSVIKHSTSLNQHLTGKTITYLPGGDLRKIPPGSGHHTAARVRSTGTGSTGSHTPPKGLVHGHSTSGERDLKPAAGLNGHEAQGSKLHTPDR
ncbi:Hypothetical predicted protein [Pelobates cultripes]|uniref:Uncharacterized protein n=1 Tax=Pelobates cultripes TaxID=61616 RepID=A0AAD1QY02_PELCU|nr:Hypothetical predicted protein [Pelobates cultripes]